MKNILYILLLFLNIQIFSQSQLQSKYWHYRERFNKYFVNIGVGPLKSVPVETRNNYMSPKLNFGDGGVNLGWYISVLATEYRLLKNNNKNTDKTLKELYYALLAYQRLDECETKEPWNKTENSLNGYFNRSDVEKFLGPMDVTTWNTGLDPNINAWSPAYTVPTLFYVDNSDIDPDEYGTGLKRVEMSQDQAIGLLMGFALVKKCFEDNPVGWFHNLNGTWMNYNFREKAVKFSHLIVHHVQNNLSDNWIIKNPDDETAEFHEGGAYAIANSYGFIKALQFIEDDYPAISGSAFASLPVWLAQLWH